MTTRIQRAAVTASLLFGALAYGCGGVATSASDGGTTEAGDKGDASIPDGGSTSDSSTPPDAKLPPPGVPPLNHRPVATECSHERGPGYNSDAGTDAGLPNCSNDAQCTAGQNGRCLSGRLGQQCSYDECFVDSTCAGGACLCRAPNSVGANYCTQAMRTGCHIDSDCGANGYCSPSFDSSCGAYSGIVGYYCHTKADECLNDSDCGAQPSGYCAFEPRLGKWACAYTQCAG